MSDRILVVDDDRSIRETFEQHLGGSGYEVVTASDAEQALTLLELKQPDLIITDFQMPYMTGLELCRALAADAPTAHIPVLILTARGYALEDEDLKIGNIKGVLSKPFSPRAVLQLVKETLSPGGQDETGTQSDTEAA